MKLDKSRTINCLLIIFSISLPFFLTDLILKNLRLPKDYDRLMILSGSGLYSGKEGYKRYESNKYVEQMAIYGDKFAYRYGYETNNLGLVSYPNLNKLDELDLVINGDSYTEGQGGYAWVPDWQKNELTKYNILSLNYAIAGNGFGDFLRSSIHAKDNFNAKKNIIFFIEHDAYRPYVKFTANNFCSFVSKDLFLENFLGPLNCKASNIWHHLDSNKSNSQILRKAKYLQNYGVISSSHKFAQSFKKTFSNKDIQMNQNKNKFISKKPNLNNGYIPEYTLKDVREIINLYGKKNVLFVQLPERPGKQKENELYFTNLFNQIFDTEVVNLWEYCTLSNKDFNELDSHPNKLGYEKIKECIKANKRISNFIIN